MPYLPMEAFNSHLDGCTRCRNHPFNLCAVGAQLLERAAAPSNGEQARANVALYDRIFGAAYDDDKPRAAAPSPAAAASGAPADPLPAGAAPDSQEPF